MDLSIPKIIRRKRDGHQLTPEEIHFFIESVVTNTIDDSQTGAMLMAMYLNKLTTDETVCLVKSMIRTGETLQFKNISKDVLVDKHSTGGVGDKTSLILAPSLAACGLKVPMISGRSLGFTGGTLDKLESIPNFQVNLNFDQMNECLEKSGCFICGANESLAPADSILYKIRDITGTVEDQSLIVASILSKKAAEGIGSLIMDVKIGKGTALKTENDGKKMAELLQEVGKNLNLNIRIVLSDMNVPLGSCVGNSLEVIESIRCLRNEISNSVSELVKLLGGVLLHEKGIAKTLEDGKKLIQKSFENFTALDCFRQMLVSQGVSKTLAEDLCSGNYWKVLRKAPYTTILRSNNKGVVVAIDAMCVAQVCWHLGGGRVTADSDIDHSVGVVLLKTVGEHVDEGEPWIEVHHASEKLPPDLEILIQNSLTVDKAGRGVNETLKTILI